MSEEKKNTQIKPDSQPNPSPTPKNKLEKGLDYTELGRNNDGNTHSWQPVKDETNPVPPDGGSGVGNSND